MWPDPTWAEQTLVHTWLTSSVYYDVIYQILSDPSGENQVHRLFLHFSTCSLLTICLLHRSSKMLSSFIWFFHSVFSNCYTPSSISFTNVHIPASNYSQTSRHCIYCTLQIIIEAVCSFFWSGIYAILLLQCCINWWRGIQGNGIELNVILSKYHLQFNSVIFCNYWFSQKQQLHIQSLDNGIHFIQLFVLNVFSSDDMDSSISLAVRPS